MKRYSFNLVSVLGTTARVLALVGVVTATVAIVGMIVLEILK